MTISLVLHLKPIQVLKNYVNVASWEIYFEDFKFLKIFHQLFFWLVLREFHDLFIRIRERYWKLSFELLLQINSSCIHCFPTFYTVLVITILIRCFRKCQLHLPLLSRMASQVFWTINWVFKEKYESSPEKFWSS
jgi:hypothetical protein